MAPRTPRPSAVLDYRFRQRFRVPARAAYDWATDYTPEDWGIAGLEGTRRVERLAPEIVRLTDRAHDAAEAGVEKVRIVQLYPAALAWVSTHVGGPCLHSQFRYAVRPLGPRRSELLFEGREIRWEARAAAPATVRSLRRTLRRADQDLWRSFARAMARDLGATAGPRRPPRAPVAGRSRRERGRK